MKAIRPLGIPVDQMTWSALLARQAARNGDKTFLTFEGRTWSYGQVDVQSAALARGLLAAGVRQGDHVALFLGNCAEALLLNMALGRIGAVTCPINTAAKGDLLAYFLNLCKATTAIVGEDLASRFAEAEGRAPGVRRLVLVDTGETPTVYGGDLPRVAFSTLHDASVDNPLPVVRAEDPQTIMFTSGTTGPSKGVLITNAQSFQFSIGRVEYLGLQADDVVYTCLPLFHGNALNAASVCAFVADGSLVLCRRFSARAFWSDVREHGVTQFNLLSSMTNILWGMEPSPADRDHRVRQCTMVPVPGFASEFAQRFGVEIVSSYSLTDFGQGTFLQPGAPADKFRSAGQARPGVDLAILDDEGRAVPAGVAGEICLRSADPSLGGRSYFGLPQSVAQSSPGDWFPTGDRGYVDADGYLFFVDRKKDAIRRRGENISSWEVEQVIAQHPAVADVAVYAVASEQSEDEVAASVVLRPGCSVPPEELIRFCERNLAYFMVPRFLDFRTELPRTLTEKVQKPQLRQQAEARRAELWDRDLVGIELKR